MLTGTSCENFPFKKQFPTQRRSLASDLNTYHKPTSAHIHDLTVTLCHRMQTVNKVLTHLSSILHQVLLSHHIKHSYSSGTCKMIATECSAKHPFPRFYGRRY